MKTKQLEGIHASSVQSALKRIHKAGLVTQSIHNILTEFAVREDVVCEDLLFMERRDGFHMQDALDIIGHVVEEDSVTISRALGFDDPN